MADFEVVEHPRENTAVIHERVAMGQLPQFFSRAFASVYSAMREQGVDPAGPPFAHYLGKPGEWVDVEAGFPVTHAIEEVGPVHSGELPAAPCIHGVHVGPYDKMEETYGRLMTWAEQHHLTPHDDMWEVYLSDPAAEPDPKTWRTEIWWPAH